MVRSFQRVAQRDAKDVPASGLSETAGGERRTIVRRTFSTRIRMSRVSSRHLLLGVMVALAASIATGIASDRPASTRPAAVPGNDAYDWKKWSQFWAFRPVQKPAVPA